MTELRGSLAGLGLDRVLQIMADIQASGRLFIADPIFSGEVVLQSGRVVGARFGPERGLDAVSSIVLALSEATFEVMPVEAPAELNITLSPEELRAHIQRLSVERDELLRSVPCLSGIPRRRGGLPGDAHAHDQLTFDVDMVRVLLAVDGRRGIPELARGLGLHRTLRAVARLAAIDMLDVDEPSLRPADTRELVTLVGEAPPAARAGGIRSRVLNFFVVQGTARSAVRPLRQIPPTLIDPLVRSRLLAAPGFFASLARVTYSHRWAVLLACLILIGGAGAYGSAVTGALKTGGYTDPASESSLADETLRRQLGHEQNIAIALFSSSDGLSVDSPEYRDAVEETLARAAAVPGVGHIDSYYSTGAAQFVSSDRHETFATIGLEGDDSVQVKEAQALRPVLTSTRLQVRLGGWPAITDELTGQVTHDLENAELLTFPILAALLLVIYGSVVAAGLPLAIGTAAIVASFCILRFVAGWTDVSLLALNVITMFGLGLAIDYSLLIVSRFREELAASGGDVQVALLRTMRTAGRTVLFSGLTVVISLLSLMVFAPMFLRSLGFGGATAVLMAMLSALTILPAALAILGRNVDLLSVRSPLRRGPASATQQRRGFWYRLSGFVMRHPGMVFILTLVPLIWLGLPFLRITFGLPDANSLPTHHESRHVADALSHDFSPNEAQPIIVLIRSAGPALDAANLDALYDYTRQIAALPNVRRVDDLVTVDPGLDRASYAAFYSSQSRAQNPLAAQAASHFANGNYSMVSVVYDGDPYSSDVQNLVKAIRQLNPPPGLKAQVTGWPTYLLDLLTSLGQRLPLAFGLIVMVMFILLFLLLGSVVVPFKAVILNVLSLAVSFGTLVWVFQDGHLASWLGFTPMGNIDTTQPVIIFAAAFGLSMDYEVFLLSRIKEQYDRTGDMWAAVSGGIQKTGAIITSAAVLLVVVFLSFMQGEVLFIKEVGLGLAVAILVDATVVRMLLLPATMRLLGAYNWWAPAPLAALYRRLGLGEYDEDAPALAERVDGRLSETGLLATEVLA